MGNAQSQVPKEGQGHPEQFYRGVAAAKCGRFTVSEVYFVQALQRHPGRAFWEPLMQSLSHAAGKEGDASATGDPTDAEAEPGSAYESAWAELQTVRSERHRLNGNAAESGDAVTQVTELRSRKSACSDMAAHPSHFGASMNASTANSVPASSKLGAGAAHLYSATAVDIHLPLNTELPPILDYYRLTADIALTYLDLLPRTQHVEKVSGLAARYCLFGITHTQALLHCLTLWKEETFGDGLGFVDYEGRRRQTALTDGVPHRGATGTQDGQQSTQARQSGRELPRTAARNFTLALVEAHCRYYHVSLVVSYSFLLAKTMQTTADVRRRHLIQANLMDHLDTVFRVAWEVAEEYPCDYVGKLITRNVPSPMEGGYEPAASNPGSSCVSTLQLLSLSGDTQRHMCMIGAGWLPLQSGLLPLSFARDVRLRVHEAAFRHTEGRVLSPGERVSYFYISWALDAAIVAVPGCSPYMLQRALPGFVPGKGTMAHQTEMHPQMNASASDANVAAVPGARRPAADSTVPPLRKSASMASLPEAVPVTSGVAKAKRAKWIAKHRKEMQRSGRNMNTDLDLSDERTLVMLCQNEVASLSLGAMLLSLRLHAAVGDASEVHALGASLRRMISGIHGPESAEMEILRFFLEGGASS